MGSISEGCGWVWAVCEVCEWCMRDEGCEVTGCICGVRYVCATYVCGSLMGKCLL